MLMIDPPIPQRFDGIMRHARERGWRLTLSNRLVRAPMGWAGDGALVTLRRDAAVVRFAEDLARRGIPVVDLTFHRPDIDVPRVVPDYEGAGRLAARHFIEIGLKRVAWFSTEWSNVQRLFCKGLEEGMTCAGTGGMPSGSWTGDRRHGRVRNPVERIVLSEIVPRSRLDDPDRFAATMWPRLRALVKPVGILAYNDEEAARLEALCLDAGIDVPGDVAILGIGDDAFICENQPVPLSSIDDELERNGYEAAALLDSLMAGERPPGPPVLVPCTRVKVRPSTDTLAVESAILRRALDMMFDDLKRVPSIPQVAKAVGVSRATLDRLFLKGLGCPAHEALLRRRLAKARELLGETTLAAAEISDICGFCNPAYFSLAFKRSEGVTPRKWRKSPT